MTLKRIGFFCFPIKHSTHTLPKSLGRPAVPGPKAGGAHIRKVNVRDVSGMLVERVFLVSGVVTKKNKRSFFFFLVREKRGRTQL